MPLHVFTHARKVGLVDETGRIHVSALYDRFGTLSEDRRPFVRNFKHGCLDGAGHPIIPSEYSWLQPFAHGVSMASHTTGSYGLLDPHGEWVVEPAYSGLRPVSETLAVAQQIGKKKWGLLDFRSGTWVVEPEWAEARTFAGRLAVKKGRKWGAIDLAGTELLAASFSLIQSNADGSWLVQDKKGAAFRRLAQDGTEEHVYAEDIVEVRPYRADLAPARQGKLWGLVDRDGAWALEPVSTWCPDVVDGEPIRIVVARKIGYAEPGKGVTIAPQFTHAGDFVHGRAVADGTIIDTGGAVVARIDPQQNPVVPTPPPPPKDRAAKALIAVLRRRTNKVPDADVLAAISRLPDTDLAALLHTWYRSGMPWIQLGPWDLWTTTYGTALEKALKTGSKPLPFGHGEYNDPINVRFKRGRLEIGIDTNPDDARPRTFRTLRGFTDAMVIDGLGALEGDEVWPLPAWLTTFFAAGGIDGYAKEVLDNHVARVVRDGGEGAEEARAWLAEHGTPEPDTSTVTMTFTACDAPLARPEAPADVDTLLKAGGHLYYLQGATGCWVSVTNKGIRFANAKGKKKVAGLSSVGRDGPALVLVDDDATAIVTGHNVVLKVTLANGKKEALFERPYGEVMGMTPTPDGTRIVAALRGEDYVTTALRVYDLAGDTVGDIGIPDMKFARQLLPLWDDLVVVTGSSGAIVVDVGRSTVVALFEGSVKEARVVGRRFTLSQYGSSHYELG